MSSAETKSGFTLFVLAFVGTVVFFLYVLFAANEGPLDMNMWEAGPGFTQEEKKERDNLWRTSSAEMVAEGARLFEANIFGPREEVANQILAGQFGSKETEVYRVLTHGIPGTEFKRMDFLPQSVRWKMVHFMRSKMSNPERAMDDDWESLDQEGI